MKHFLINLDRSPHRLREMRAIFDAMGLSFQRVGAVDAEILSFEQRTECCTNDALSAGTVCCFLSHRLCWQKLVESNEPYAAIFEDDIVFSTKAHSVLSDFSWLPESFDIIRLETYLRRTAIEKQSIAEISGYRLHRLKADHVGTGGYIVSRECARRLLDKSRTFTVSVDHFLFRSGKGPFTELKVLQFFPALCIQQQFVSKDAPSSQITHEKKKKPQGIAKLKRELSRPFQKLAYLIKATFMNLFSNQRLGRVPFYPEV